MIVSALALLLGYTVTDLNVDVDSYGPAYLNDQGAVAGNLRTNDGGDSAFLWTRAGLFRLGGVRQIYGLNNHNQLAITTPRGKPGIWEHGRIRTVENADRSHGLVPGGVPFGIDDSGTLFLVARGVEGVYAVWTWPKERDLSGAPSPEALSPDGWIAGVRSYGLWVDSREGPSAFLYERAKKPYDRDPGQPIGSDREVANPKALTVGHRVGGSFRGPDSNEEMPFVWEKGHFARLPVPGERASGVVNGLNDRGEAVGQASSGGAALWKDGRFVDLRALLPAQPAYNMIAALAINEKGQILVTAERVARPFPRTLLLLTPLAG